MAKKNFYAVRAGRKTGIFYSWEECRQQVEGYSGSLFQGFVTEKEAQQWLKKGGITAPKRPAEHPLADQADKIWQSPHHADRARKLAESRIQKEVHKNQKDVYKNRKEVHKNQKDVQNNQKSIHKNRQEKEENLSCCYENLNEEQKAAFQFLLNGGNVFLTGEAGTGKSFLLNVFLDRLKGKNVLVCAPTGIAALQIRGATIHSVFRLKPQPYLPDQPLGRIRDTVKAADIIVIDEISMCRFDLFDYLCRYIHKAGQMAKKPKQVIVVGDFSQLPPVIAKDRDVLEEGWKEQVEDISAGFAFLAPGWDKMDFSTIVLKQVMRQKEDAGFLENLNKIRNGNASAVDWFNRHTSKEEQPGIYMSALNKRVDERNQQKMEQLHTEKRTYEGVSENFQDTLPTKQSLVLCEGARVMSLLNDAGGDYQNGSLGTVKRLKENSVMVAFDNGCSTEIAPYTWEDIEYQVEVDENTKKPVLKQVVTGRFTQLPLRVAFAVTIHKSQGQTYDSVNLDPYCFDVGQLYVALSRVTSVQRLHLSREIKRRDLLVSQDVRQFYERALAKELPADCANS